MTLRQLWVRIKALPPDSPLWREVAADIAENEARQASRDVDDALAMFKTRGV